jgi:hypothetical protein
MICKGTVVLLDYLDLLTVVCDSYSKTFVIISEWKRGTWCKIRDHRCTKGGGPSGCNVVSTED